MRNKDIPAVVQICLREYHITEYPVDLLKIARSAGIRVLRNSDVHTLQTNEYGKCYVSGKDCIIVYDDTQVLETKRFIVAHELGHIFLDHRREHERFARHIEKQADLFAACLIDSSQGEKS